MTTCWFKPAFSREDRDPETGELRPDAMRPGIYCKDEATYERLMDSSRLRGAPIEYHMDGDVSVVGMRIYSATPEQAEALERGPSMDPASYYAEQRAETEAAATEFARLMGRLTSMVSTTREPARHAEPPVPGANRAQRRADAARKRSLA